jgi:hypothetical protein
MSAAGMEMRGEAKTALGLVVVTPNGARVTFWRAAGRVEP